MAGFLSTRILNISLKAWVFIIIMYLVPALVDYLAKDQFHYLQSILWLFYLIPTIIFVYSNGAKSGGISIGVGLIILLITESFHEKGLEKGDFLELIELTIVNILITFVVGALVKNNNEKQLQLNGTKNLLESILNNLEIGVWSIDKHRHLHTSKGVAKIYGVAHEDDAASRDFWKNSIHSEDRYIVDEIDRNWANLESYHYEYRIQRKNGEVRWIYDRGIPVFMENGELLRFDGINFDITKQKELEFKFLESEERYKHLVDNSLVGVFLVQNRELVYVNHWIAELLGVTADDLVGFHYIKHLKDQERDQLHQHFQQLLDGKNNLMIEQVQVVAKDQSIKYVEIHASLTAINGDPAIIGSMIDLTEKKKAKEEIEYVAYHDTLTGLYNMNYLNHQLMNDFHLNKSNGFSVSIMFFNLDRFKLINDSYGHYMGDQLLKLVSKRLTHLVQPDGTVLRAGGDEFILYLPKTNAIQAEEFASLLMKEFSKPIILKKKEISIAASIGISPSFGDESLDAVIQKASSALNFAKELGRNQYQFYSDEFRKLANRRLQLEQGFRKALTRKGFDLFYQPKLDLSTGRITGMEALIRWSDPVLGVISPVEFIPIAEETGLIVQLGKWVLETACLKNSEWLRNGYPPMHVCVNISSKQFLQGDFVNMIKQVISDSGLPPELLNLEITEGIALYNIDDTIMKLKQIKKLGVSISLDDFGTGYSSLSYLKSLPIDFLKIDRSFINGIVQKQDAAIIHSIITLAHSLGLKVIAEGVEEELQQQLLVDMECDEIQGYYLSKPLSSNQFKQFLDKNTAVGV